MIRLRSVECLRKFQQVAKQLDNSNKRNRRSLLLKKDKCRNDFLFNIFRDCFGVFVIVGMIVFMVSIFKNAEHKKAKSISPFEKFEKQVDEILKTSKVKIPDIVLGEEKNFNYEKFNSRDKALAEFIYNYYLGLPSNNRILTNTNDLNNILTLVKNYDEVGNKEVDEFIKKIKSLQPVYWIASLNNFLNRFLINANLLVNVLQENNITNINFYKIWRLQKIKIANNDFDLLWLKNSDLKIVCDEHNVGSLSLDYKYVLVNQDQMKTYIDSLVVDILVKMGFEVPNEFYETMKQKIIVHESIHMFLARKYEIAKITDKKVQFDLNHELSFLNYFDKFAPVHFQELSAIGMEIAYQNIDEQYHLHYLNTKNEVYRLAKYMLWFLYVMEASDSELKRDIVWKLENGVFVKIKELIKLINVNKFDKITHKKIGIKMYKIGNYLLKKYDKEK